MTQILNVPMPADEAINIIRAMYESNSMLEVEFTARCYNKLDFGNEENIQVEEIRNYQQFISFDDTFQIVYDGWEITINSITPLIPTYSVWQEVMILATGEIGSISKLRDEAREKPIEINNDTDQFYHRSEICKIAQK